MKKLLVTSFVKEELLALGCDLGVKLVAASAVDWLQAEAERMIQYAATHGKVTAGGKLQPPAEPYPVAQATTPDGGAKAKDFPERVCYRVKEWRALSDEDKARHLTEVFVSWFALNTDEKSEALHKLYITPVAEGPAVAGEEEEKKPSDKKVPGKKVGRTKASDDMFAL